MKKFNLIFQHPVFGIKLKKYQTSKNNSIQPRFTSELVENLINQKVQEYESKFKSTLTKEKKNAYESGFRAGELKFSKEYKKKFSQPLQIISNILSKMTTEVETISNQHEEEILNLILNISKKIVTLELKLQPEILLNVIRKSLSMLSEREELIIYVNTENWHLIKERFADLQLQLDIPKDIEIITSEKISFGGCKIVSKAGAVDATIESQFEEIKRNLFK